MISYSTIHSAKEGKIHDLSQPIYWKNYFVKEEFLYLTIMQSNALLQFNMKDGSYHIFCVGSVDNRYGALTYADNAYWLLEYKKSEVIRWKNGQIKTYDINFAVCGDLSMARMVNIGDEYILVVPYAQETRILKMNIQTEQWQCIQKPSTRNSAFFDGYRCVKRTDRKAYIVKSSPLAVITISQDKKETCYPLDTFYKPGNIEFLNFIKWEHEPSYIWPENALKNGIEDFTEWMSLVYKVKKQNVIKNCGELIYRQLLNI